MPRRARTRGPPLRRLTADETRKIGANPKLKQYVRASIPVGRVTRRAKLWSNRQGHQRKTGEIKEHVTKRRITNYIKKNGEPGRTVSDLSNAQLMKELRKRRGHLAVIHFQGSWGIRYEGVAPDQWKSGPRLSIDELLSDPDFFADYVDQSRAEDAVRYGVTII